MEKNSLIEKLRDFLTQEPACVKSLLALSEKAEVGIHIADSIQLCVFHQSGEVIVEEKKTFASDFIFSASPEAIEVLIAEKGLNPGQLGVKLIKQVISRDIKIAMPASPFQVSKKGYFNLLKVGGADFLGELKKHNLASIPKILSALKSLKKP